MPQLLETLYAKLLAHYGAQYWWPHESKWEIMVGAILTQNTSWRNVERALENLKRADALAPRRIRALRLDRLAKLIRPAGFTSSKPRRLKSLAKFLLRAYADEPDKMRGGDLMTQRAQLLALHGVGPETADAILLYAAHQPIFVIDAYTRRILTRLGLAESNAGYQELQALFMENLPPDAALFNEFHALLDTHAKYTCTKRAPHCAECPLNQMCLRKGLETGDGRGSDGERE
ncbi:MAG: endonuclease III domain-containing protein [Chloroflexi bacterium]|nr:endonuclease III domain-containing protein [Chloroflexota bacterium]